MKSALLSLVVFLLSASHATAERNPFPRPAELEPDVRFWTRIYTEVGTSGGLIHDDRQLGIVYEVVSFPKGLSRRARQRLVEKKKRGYKEVLLSLARGKRSNLSRPEKRLLALFPRDVSNSTLRSAAHRVRFQLGQANKFREGLIRAGAWEPHIRKTIEEMDLPIELAALPHVESSYTPHAYSRVGASGLWQFTRSTGRRFLRIDHVVDERLDPHKSTVAAARLLEQNRRTTGSWPLAITAYNHGAAGMRRAVRILGTHDIETIVRKYRGRTFRFASRNFYVEFLAAVDVDFHAKKYFGKLRTDTPVEYETFELPYFTKASALQRALGIDLGDLKQSNPALRPSVWRGSKYIPRGYTLRIPRDQLARPVDGLLDRIPSSQRFAAQQRDTFHRVRRGETLSQIASRYRTSMSRLVEINGLRSRHRIRAGQRLRLPDTGGGGRVARASLQPAPSPLPPPADGKYRVRRGDTISRIATRFGLEEQNLIRANGLRNRNRIYVGQTLRLSPPEAVPAQADEASRDDRLAAPNPAAPSAVVESPDRETTRNPSTAEDVPTASAVEPAVVEGGTPSSEEPVAEAIEEADPSLLADPSDYSVSSDGRIEVQALETLGHYAEWLGVRASELRRINHMRYRDPLVVGRPLRLDFGRISPEQFERQRVEYHRGVQGEFFEQFEIAGTRVHVMRRGDSIWALSRREDQLPLWLLRQYNPDLDFEDLRPGARITVPLVKPHRDPSKAVEATESGSAADRSDRTVDGEA